MSKGYIIIIIVGVVLLPFSPFLALAGMLLTAWLLSRPYQPKAISKRKRNRIISDAEQEQRKNLASSTETVYFCPSCGAAYTGGFLSEFSIPDHPQKIERDDSIHNPCFYCGNEISVAVHPQGYYEQQANSDDVNVLGEHQFPKPLRFRRYVLKENAVIPDEALSQEYLRYLKKQVFLHYVIHIQLVRRVNPYADIGFDQLSSVMSYTMDLQDMSRKYDLVGVGKVDQYDLFYLPLSQNSNQELLSE